MTKHVRVRLKKKRKTLSENAKALLLKRFKGCKRIGAVIAKYYKGLGPYIEVYDVGDPNNVGVIFPDCNCQLWLKEWFENHADRVEPLDNIPYNQILNKDYKRVHLKPKRIRLKK